MHRFEKFTSLLLCAGFSLSLMSCTAKPTAAESSDITNVFEATTTVETGESTTVTTETESSATSESTAETSETTAATTTVATTSEATTTTTETSASETSPSSAPSETSATSTFSDEISAIYTKNPEEKKNYIIYNEAFGGTITESAMNKGFIGITIPSDGTNLYGNIPAEALEFTLFYDERQNLTLRDLQGRFLAATSTGDLILTDKPVEDNYQFWRLEKAEGGWHIINVGAAGNQALQYSSGTFSIKKVSNAKEFVFNFYEVG